LRPALVAVSACLAALVLGAAPAAASRSESRMVRAVNHFRSAHALPRLRASSDLGRSAGGYSRWMLRTGYFGHASRPARLAPGRRFGCFGEVLARHTGAHPRVRRTMRMWKGSGGHRAVLLNRSYGWVGAGKALGVFHGWRTTLWTVQVGCSRKG
jgi:uncharacterized protein YkwD